jgi:hypothetical protein
VRLACGLLPAVAAAIVLAVTGCGSSDDDPSAKQPTKKFEITVGNDGYSPWRLRVPVDSRVTFLNVSDSPQSAKDDPSGTIDVSPRPGPTNHDGSEVNRATKKGFATHALFTGERQTIVFPVARTYTYHSAFDEDKIGTIKVVDEE